MPFGRFRAALQYGQEVRRRLKPPGERNSGHLAFDFRDAVLQRVGDAKEEGIAGPIVRHAPSCLARARLTQLEATALEFTLGEIHAHANQARAVHV